MFFGPKYPKNILFHFEKKINGAFITQILCQPDTRVAPEKSLFSQRCFKCCSDTFIQYL